MGKLTDAKMRANKKWDKKNKERKYYITMRSRAKNFILKMATDEDLKQILEFVEERKNQKNS